MRSNMARVVVSALALGLSIVPAGCKNRSTSTQPVKGTTRSNTGNPPITGEPTGPICLRGRGEG